MSRVSYVITNGEYVERTFTYDHELAFRFAVQVKNQEGKAYIKTVSANGDVMRIEEVE